VKVSAAVLAALLALPLPALAATQVSEQTVTPVPADTEQRVEPVTSPDEQHVEALDGDGVQGVVEGTSQAGPVRRGLDQVAKVAIGVLAAGVSIGVMVASLLFI
jgi:hypothetical protein